MKKIISTLIVSTMLFAMFTGCSSQDGTGVEITPSVSAQASVVSTADYDIIQLGAVDQFSTSDYEVGYIYDTVVNVSLADNASSADSEIVKISGNEITISSEGSYIFTGSLSEGQIIVDANDTTKVQIVLNGVNITNSSSATIYVPQADKVFVTTSAESTLTSTIIEDETTNIDATIFSKADLTLNGDSVLNVVSNDGNGITSKDDLVVSSGQYEVTATGHGLEANNSIRVASGDITIYSGKDGLHSEHDEDAELGYIYIASGTFNIEAQGDGIDSSSQVEILDGDFNILVAGGSINAPEITSTFNQGGMSQAGMTQGGMSQGGMSQGGMSQGTMPDSGMTMPEGTMPEGIIPDSGMTVPDSGMTMPGGTMPDSAMTMPEGIIPDSGMTMPEGIIPDSGMTMPEGTMPDSGMTMPGGTMPDSAMTMPDGTMTDSVGTVTDDTISTKAIKANSNVVITGGNFAIDSMDDAIHSNGSVYITNGTFAIQTGDDGITSKYITSIAGGVVTITDCYEGIEGQQVKVSGGEITIKANDDGINAVVNDVGIIDTDTYIEISGGIIKMDVDNTGDGVDSNGDIYMTGGEMYVWGTTDFTDTPLDYGGSSYITGGIFVSVGSASQTAQNFGEESTQGSIWVQLSATQSDDVTLTDSNGNVIVEFNTDKEYQAITISTPDIVQGETYVLTAGDYTETIVMETLIYGEGNESGGFGGGTQQGGRR